MVQIFRILGYFLRQFKQQSSNNKNNISQQNMYNFNYSVNSYS